ncbi:MAG: hypothetical protein ABH812_02135 [bacterium]
MIDKVFAQQLNVGGNNIQGPLVGVDSLGDVISVILPLLIIAAGIILFFILLLSGIQIMTSAGNPEKLKAAGAKITWSLVGFVMLALSYIIIKLISNIFGLGQGLF